MLSSQKFFFDEYYRIISNNSMGKCVPGENSLLNVVGSAGEISDVFFIKDEKIHWGRLAKQLQPLFNSRGGGGGSIYLLKVHTTTLVFNLYKV